MLDKLLLVDDDREFREEFTESFSGYEVLLASDGQEALNMLSRPNEIDLVIMDVLMPGLNGIEVLKRIRKNWPELGIIILTGYSSKDVAIEALKAHADDYIEKPVDIEKVKEIIDNVLDARKDSKAQPMGGTSSKIEKVKRFVERNCFKKVSLKDAAQAVFLSPKYLSRIFEDITGDKFTDYRLKVKVKQAKILLRKNSYNINQLADKLGYQNAESFIRQFKKLTGFTPAHFRNSERKKNRK